MPKEDFKIKLNRVLASGYFLLFAVIIGGPIFISASAIAAAWGYDIYLIFIVSFLGEMAVDILFYYVGRFGRGEIVDKYGRYFHLTAKRIEKLEALVVKHSWKTLFVIKYSPFPIPGFVLSGAVGMDFKKFFYILFALSIPKTLFFTVVAALFGQAYNSYVKYYDYGQYLLISAVILYIAANYLFKYFQKKLQKDNGDINEL